MEDYKIYNGKSFGVVHQCFNFSTFTISIDIIGTHIFIHDFDMYYCNNIITEIEKYKQTTITHDDYDIYKYIYLDMMDGIHVHGLFQVNISPKTGWVDQTLSVSSLAVDLSCSRCKKDEYLIWYCNCKLAYYCSENCLNEDRSTHLKYCPNFNSGTYRKCVIISPPKLSQLKQLKQSNKSFDKNIKIFIGNRIYDNGQFEFDGRTWLHK